MTTSNNGRYVVLLPASSIRRVEDLDKTLRARALDLQERCASGKATDEDREALKAVNHLLGIDEPPEPSGNGQQEPDSLQPVLLRVGEAARLLGLSQTTVRDLMAKGDLPFVRIGAAVRIRRDQLEAWVDELSSRQQGGRHGS